MRDGYDKLGPVSTLKPTETGGTEHKKMSDPLHSTRGDPRGVIILSAGANVPIGHGRISRGEQENAVDIGTSDTDRHVGAMGEMDPPYVESTWTQLDAHTASQRRLVGQLTNRSNSVPMPFPLASGPRGRGRKIGTCSRQHSSNI